MQHSHWESNDSDLQPNRDLQFRYTLVYQLRRNFSRTGKKNYELFNSKLMNMQRKLVDKKMCIHDLGVSSK